MVATVEQSRQMIPPEGAEDVGLGTIYLPPGVALSDVLHWIEEGSHHFRSLEFDVIADDEDEQTAVNKFVEWTEDLLDLLRDQDHPTEEDQGLYRLLSDRFRAAYTKLEERERRRRLIEINIGRHRRLSRGNWRPRSGSQAETSSPASIGS